MSTDEQREFQIRRRPQLSGTPDVEYLLTQLDQARAEALPGPVAEITAQRARNHAKWGDQSIENRPPDYAGWLPTLGEEFGEVCRTMTLEQADPARRRSELIDLAAVALMWIDAIDRAKAGQ